MEQQSISQVENIAVIGIVEAVIKEYQAPDFSIAFSGTPVYQYHVEPMVRSNMKKMCIAILIVSVLFMPFVFGRGSGAYLPQVTAILGLMVALGLMALLSVRFSLTSSMLPSILLSIGLTAPIHFLVVYYKYQKRVGKFRGIIATMKHSGFPITMTSFTTVAGMLSFTILGYRAYRGFDEFHNYWNSRHPGVYALHHAGISLNTAGCFGCETG